MKAVWNNTVVVIQL